MSSKKSDSSPLFNSTIVSDLNPSVSSTSKPNVKVLSPSPIVKVSKPKLGVQSNLNKHQNDDLGTETTQLSTQQTSFTPTLNESSMCVTFTEEYEEKTLDINLFTRNNFESYVHLLNNDTQVYFDALKVHNGVRCITRNDNTIYLFRTWDNINKKLHKSGYKYENL